MVATYRHFKKHEEIFCGMSLFTLLKVALMTIVMTVTAINLKLAINSPLFLLMAIIWMVISAVIIKADSGDEVKGFYSSFFTHPLKNHLFPLFSDKERRSRSIAKTLPKWKRNWNPFDKALQEHEQEFDLTKQNTFSTKEGFTSISDLQNVKSVNDEYLLSKEGDLLAFIRLDNGVAWSNLNAAEQTRVIDSWGKFLSQFKSISSMQNYFGGNSELGDSVQAFVWAKPYQFDFTNADADSLSEQYQKAWHQELFAGNLFIPDLEFYLVIRHKRGRNKLHPLHKLFKKHLPGWLPADMSLMTEEEFEEEYNLLKQKIDVAQNTLLSMDIRSHLLVDKELKDFCNQFLPITKMIADDPLQASADIQLKAEDKSKYLLFDGRFYKTYRVHMPPEDGNLDAWLRGYYAMFESEAMLSIQWTPRDAIADRRHAERKADVMTQLAKSNKSSTMAIIRENKEIAEELVAQPYSFDMVIYLTIVCDSLDQLQKVDNRIRRPVAQATISPLDRQQMHNWVYSLPFAYNNLADSEKLFATKNFAQSCMPFFKNEIGSKAGPLLGLSLEDMRPVFLDEYDRSVCNNRGINFIGDSGSGKTVAAKLAVKRRLERGGSFIIVDNTQDGWQFFMDYFAGTVVDIDTSISPDGKVFFAPLKLPDNYTTNELNAQIERVSKLLSIIKERATVLDAFEEVFLIKSLQELYKENKEPCLSDLYTLWKKPSQAIVELYSAKYFNEWAELIAPYCRVCDGIYAGLMDGNEARIEDDAKLLLFTFTKIDSNSNFLPVSLCLVANYVSQRVVFGKEAGVSFVIDEAWKMFSGRNAARGKELLTYFARAGRGMDLGLWTISQKPQDLPREIHSSASASMIFQLKETQDRRDMLTMASLTEAERKFLELPEMADSGTALLKTTRSSGLLKVLMDPLEEVLVNSTRDFVNRRNIVFERSLIASGADFNDRQARSEAAAQTVKELLLEMQGEAAYEY